MELPKLFGSQNIVALRIQKLSCLHVFQSDCSYALVACGQCFYHCNRNQSRPLVKLRILGRDLGRLIKGKRRCLGNLGCENYHGILSYGSSALMSCGSRMLSLGNNVATTILRVFLLKALEISFVSDFLEWFLQLGIVCGFPKVSSC